MGVAAVMQLFACSLTQGPCMHADGAVMDRGWLCQARWDIAGKQLSDYAGMGIDDVVKRLEYDIIN
jgi:hypothetical protein